MKTKKLNPEIKDTESFGKVVRIHDVYGFAKWLNGQTMPVIDEDDDPFGWAYYEDYLRYIQGKPVID